MVNIDYSKCIHCKSCIKDCFPQNLSYEDDKVKVKGACIMCGHCVAICPVGAVSFEDVPIPEKIDFEKSKISPDTFLSFVKSRRSIRHFKEKKVEREVLEKLLEVARYSPTGGNVQDVKYYVIQDELDSIKPLVWAGIKNFIESSSTDKFALKYKEYLKKMYEVHTQSDMLFFKSPLLLVITSSDKTNGVLAADKIELMANIMGLGALFSGFIELGINSNLELIKKFKLKKDVICSCMLIGYPDISYRRSAPRKEVNIKWL